MSLCLLVPQNWTSGWLCFVASWTHFPCLSDQKTRPFSGPKKRAHFTSRLFPNREAERRGRKMGPFLGGLGPKNETLPGTIRSTFGSRFQPPFRVPPRADQRFSGRSACYHSQPPNLICQTPSVSFLLPPSCSFFCLLRPFNLIATRPRILML